MCSSTASKDVTFSLKVTVNKEKTKVLFADVDSSFADVLMSFLTLPLGTIVRILKNHYQSEDDDAPTFGSLTTLFNGLSNLDTAHFWTEGAKSVLLHPESSLDALRRCLKLDISDSPPPEEFTDDDDDDYDDDDGSFTITTATFVVTDDLRIVPTSSGLLQIASFLDITDIDEAEQINVTFGYNEVMALLKAALNSSTPLSDVIFSRQLKSSRVELQRWTILDHNGKGSTPNPKKMILRIFVQKSTNKILYAQAEADFVDLLFSFLVIPLGGVERLLASKSFNKSFDLLYTSVAHIHNKYFSTTEIGNMLIKPNIPRGYISENHILPLNEDDSTVKFSEFPKGKGKYIKTPTTFMVTDDLTVTPLCLASALRYLIGMKISILDVKEVELKIGLDEALGILRASLTSSSALSDGLNLTNHISLKRPRQD